MLLWVLVEFKVAALAICRHNHPEIFVYAYGAVIEFVVKPVTFVLAVIIAEGIDQNTILFKHATQLRNYGLMHR